MELQFADATANMHKDVTRRIEACMETGNFDQARIIFEEYSEAWPVEAEALRLHLIPNYGTTL
jgi:hypothetical protein